MKSFSSGVLILIGLSLMGCQGEASWSAGEKEASAAAKASGLTGFKDVSTNTAYQVYDGISFISEELQDKMFDLAGVDFSTSGTYTLSDANSTIVCDSTVDGTAIGSGDIITTVTAGDTTQPTGTSELIVESSNLTLTYTACTRADDRGRPHVIWGSETFAGTRTYQTSWDETSTTKTNTFLDGNTGGYAFTASGVNYKMGVKVANDYTHTVVTDKATGDVSSETASGTITIEANTIKCVATLTEALHLLAPPFKCSEK